ncbi:MAG TPA: hypothetical protein GX004_00600 [Firmicutes bacterium]|nr:hypothetical protein [Bacillota bacterium]
MINVNTFQEKDIITSDNAQGLMEYSLILMLVALGVMSLLGILGGRSGPSSKPYKTNSRNLLAYPACISCLHKLFI